MLQIKVNCQVCFPNGITLSTQESIDNFQSDYPDCTEIEGELKITGADIINLDGLNSLTTLGRLWVESTSITNLSGFQNITTINKRIWIGYNSQLQSLEGLENITYLEKGLQILYNSNLESLNGVQNITKINGGLIITGNYMLPDLFELENLTSIKNGLAISGNSSLINLQGLENIDTINGGLSIENNDLLEHFNELSSLKTIKGTLAIKGNDGLQNIAGIKNIDPEEIYDIIIEGNPLLSNCAVESVCSFIENEGGDPYFIHSNDTGCNSPGEILDACLVPIHELENTLTSFDLFPNPSKNNLFILNNSTEEINTVSIFNQLGKLVYSDKSGSHILDTSKLPKGFYILKIESDTKLFSKAIIIN